VAVRLTSKLPPLFALPLAVWACGSNTVSPGGSRPTQPEAGVGQDVAMTLDAAVDAGLLDASVLDAMGIDAEMFLPDASAIDASANDAGPAPCTYPAGAVEPMAMDAVLSPYRWPSAIDGAGASAPLDLAQAYCNNDPARDWTQADVMLFVTAPAW
jgi:hypothetical protein